MKRKKAERIGHIRRCLRKADQVLEQLRYSRQVDERVLCSIALLCEVIEAATDLANDDNPHENDNVPYHWAKYSPTSLNSARSRMLESGWCSSDLSGIRHIFTSVGLHQYLSTLQGPGAGISHSLCSDDKCITYQIDPEVYETQHYKGYGACRHIYINHNKLFDIIENGGLRLVEISLIPGLRVPWLNIVEFSPGTPYIAISHIWADGLGNRKENSLPLCQLIRLKVIFDILIETFKIAGGTEYDFSKVYFWIDTLCCPNDL